MADTRPSQAIDYAEVEEDCHIYFIDIFCNWQHRHYNYPAVPSGYSQIVNRFGEPCNNAATANYMTWRAWDNGHKYPLYFHRKLGGDTSSNLDWDVKGHIRHDAYDANGDGRAEHGEKRKAIKSGIYTYACRYISGTTKWSTHAWGIAIDVSSAYESCCYTSTCQVVTRRSGVPGTFENHNWTWGKAFNDCMHFQYATNY